MIFDRILRRGSRRTAASGDKAQGAGNGSGDGSIDEAFLLRLRRVTLASERRLTSGLMGEHASPRKSHSLEFADYRNYSPGDDFRRIDWNAYLRLDHLFVTLSDAPERLHLQVLLDASRSMAWGEPDKFAYARRVAAALAYVALSHMDKASVIALRGRGYHRLSRQESAAATASIVRTLGTLEPNGHTDLNVALEAYVSQENPRGMAVLISDLLSPSGYQEGLERLSRSSARSVLVHVLSPEEMTPAMEGDLELQDVETGSTVRVTVDGGTLRQYQGWLKEWLAGIERFCGQRGITYVRAETSYPVEQLLLDRLRRERVLK